MRFELPAGVHQFKFIVGLVESVSERVEVEGGRTISYEVFMPGAYQIQLRRQQIKSASGSSLVGHNQSAAGGGSERETNMLLNLGASASVGGFLGFLVDMMANTGGLFSVIGFLAACIIGWLVAVKGN